VGVLDTRGLSDYMPWYAWTVCGVLAAVAAGTLFVGLPVAEAAGLSTAQAVLATAAVELAAGVGIGAVVVYYRDPDEETGEWRYYP